METEKNLKLISDLILKHKLRSHPMAPAIVWSSRKKGFLLFLFLENSHFTFFLLYFCPNDLIHISLGRDFLVGRLAHLIYNFSHLESVYEYFCLTFMTFWLSIGPQQGTRAWSSRMDFRHFGWTSSEGWIWGHLERWSRVVQTRKQNDTGISQENSRTWHKLPVDGKCSKVKIFHFKFSIISITNF